MWACRDEPVVPTEPRIRYLTSAAFDPYSEHVPVWVRCSWASCRGVVI